MKRFASVALVALLTLALAIVSVNVAAAFQPPVIDLPPPVVNIPTPFTPQNVPTPNIPQNIPTRFTPQNVPTPNIPQNLPTRFTPQNVPTPNIPHIAIPTRFVPSETPIPKVGPWGGNPRPDDGEIYRSPDHPGGDMELTIRIASSDPGVASYVKLYMGDAWVSGLFISGVGYATALLPAGDYTIKLGVGWGWLNAEDAFGDSGRYERLLFDGGADHVELKSGRSYTITINTDVSDPDAQGVGSRGESWEGF